MHNTMTGIIKSVGHIPTIEASKTGVNVAPTATPRMVRMVSFNALNPRMGTPISAAIMQAKIGPNSQGKGMFSHRKTATPTRAIP